MDYEQAIYLVAHDFPGGVPALAKMLAKNAGTLQNKVNPGCETHEVTVSEMVAITLASKDPRILFSVANTCGYLVVKKPSGVIGDSALLDSILKRDKEIGEFAAVVIKSLANGEISPSEMSSIETEGLEAASALLELIERLRVMCNAR